MTNARQLPIIRDVRTACAALENEDWIGLDLETSGLSPWRDRILVVSLYGSKSHQCAVLHVPGGIPEDLRTWLGDPKRKYIVHNGVNFDILFLARAGVRVFEPTWYDTLIGESVVLPMGRQDYRRNLSAALKRRLQIELDKSSQLSYWLTDDLSAEQLEYCQNDVAHLPALRQAQLEKIQASPQERAMKIEQALVPVVVKMRLNGLPVDQPRFDAFINNCSIRAVQAATELNSIFGRNINYNSHEQVKQAFLRTFGLELESTDISHLTDIQNSHTPASRAAELIIILRQATKRSGMYARDWQDKYVLNGKIHPALWQLGTDTGRFSSTEPNGQQLPKEARQLFGGRPGMQVVTADYSQIEIWCGAALARDTQLIQDLQSGDVHTAVAATLFGLPPEKITKSQRQTAKAVSFTLIFCGGVSSIIRRAHLVNIDMEDKQARAIIQQFLEKYTGIAAMRQQAFKRAAEGTPVNITTPHGLKRILVDPRPTQIVNTAVQGAAASGLKLSLLEADRRGLSNYLSLTVHDEIVAGEVPEGEAQAYARELAEAMLVGMEQAIGYQTKVETRIGTHWS